MFSCCWMFWIIARNMFFMYRWPISTMYLSQSPDPSRRPRTNWAKSSLVDMVSIEHLLSESQNFPHQTILNASSLISPKLIKLTGQPQGRDCMHWLRLRLDPLFLKEYYLWHRLQEKMVQHRRRKVCRASKMELWTLNNHCCYRFGTAVGRSNAFNHGQGFVDPPKAPLYIRVADWNLVFHYSRPCLWSNWFLHYIQPAVL